MTKEEKIICKAYLNDLDRTHDCNEYKLLMKLLGREPCEDCVSRKEVLEMIEQIQDAGGFIGYNTYSEAFDIVDNLPPVTPVACIATVKFSKEDMQELVNEKMKDIVVERKKGKWINKSQKSSCGITFVASECTCCGKKTPFNCDELLYRYCPNCGAEMEVEE